jgi:murein L,D-transpeptidase YcbB/YkuD
LDRDLRVEIGKRAGRELRAFYAGRGNRPLWIGPGGQVLAAATALLRQIETAELDGVKPKSLKPGRLKDALEAARSGDVSRLAQAELNASLAYVRFVQALRKAPHAPMIYESAALAPVIPTPTAALQRAAAAQSLVSYLQDMGWMHPYYAPLRAALGTAADNSEQRRILLVNMDRVRTLPAIAVGRWVLVDAASARLWMYDGNRVAGTMKVVVGKPETQTPAMAGFLRYAIVNPYWNLPDDLMPSRVTDKVLANGPGYIATSRMQILGSWDERATVLDPAKVDWPAVAAGREMVRARQLPGPGNFMGAVKFMFPNDQGIYLHDTPERDLLTKETRFFSNGCVRLEAAGRFGKWLLGKPLPQSRAPERQVELPVPVPIYITYLTAAPEGASIRFRPDAYGRDTLQKRVAVKQRR